MSRFHALLVVRDEVDIIEESLQHLASWADAVYVFDTGSVDGTWDVVQRVSRQSSTIHPVKREAVYFSLSKVRSYLFHLVRDHMENGDWFLRVDADERYHVDPREFVDQYMKPDETVAWRQYYDFRLTENDVARWNDNQGQEESRPVEDRLRYFSVEDWSEPRLCQYRSSMKWPADASFPRKAGIIAKNRLLIRHYPHRTPVQMAKRYALRSLQVRAEESKTEKGLDHHWAKENWRKDIITSDPKKALTYWEPDSSLPTNEHLLARPKLMRLLKHVVYRLPNPILDYWEPAYDTTERPDPLPEDLQNRIEKAYEEINAHA
jgi:hypothetical protein